MENILIMIHKANHLFLYNALNIIKDKNIYYYQLYHFLFISLSIERLYLLKLKFISFLI